MSDAVLIVDDSLTVRMDLTEALERAGYRTLSCASAHEARAVLAQQPVAVVILDVLLPDADGVELLKELREHPSCAGAAVLMLSTEAQVKDRVRGLETGADEYVGKPYDLRYVLQKVHDWTRARHKDLAEGAPRLLLIDDSETFRETLREALVAAGYQVLVAVDGEEGLRLAVDERPDGIVVDGVLPGIDGRTVLRRVRMDATLRKVPCVLLTSSEELGVEAEALEAGADAFVRKDEALPVMLARIGAVVRRSRPGPGSRVTSAMAPKRILAVDDSPTYLDAVGESLRGEGFDVVLARSGEEALEMLRVQPVDCILLDLMMPGLDGQETCRRIRAVPTTRDVPIVMMTAVENRQAMLEALSAGADDFIPKSGEKEVFIARVRAQLRRKQFEDENRQMRDEFLRKELEAAQSRAARELAETRAVLVDQLRRKNEELEAFSYSVSHDLRAPLRTINGFCTALLEDYAHVLDDEGKGHLRRVVGAATRMGELIDDLLQLSRIGRASLHRVPVDLAAIAREVAAELARRDPDRRTPVVVNAVPPADADARMMKIVLENLLGNAWKFTSKTPDSRIEFRGELQNGVPVFFVHDNGAGFNGTQTAKLFTPFQRLHLDSEFPGTGIGLATVRRIVSRHGGHVSAEGAVGQGATFSFSLPSLPELTLE